jgi:hypothetical protein
MMINSTPDTCSAIADCLEQYNGAVTAIATIFIAIFTIVLACVAGKQTRLTKDITDLARAEFISTHRPKIMVRRFRLHNDDLGGDFVEVHLTVVNKGSTKAQIEQAKGMVYFRSPDSAWPYDFDIYEGQMQISQKVLPAGGMTDAKITSIESFEHARGKYPSVSLSVPGVSVYVAGLIGYKDDIIGITRTTAFLRELNHSNHRFSAVGDDDYEYQD